MKSRFFHRFSRRRVKWVKREKKGSGSRFWLRKANIQLLLNKCENDWGTNSQLLCMLEQEPDPMTLVIIADDDMVFHPEFVEHLVQEAERTPSQHSLCITFSLCKTAWHDRR